MKLVDKYTPEEERKESEYRKPTIKWVIIDADHEGYDKYIALLYGKHPQTYYWHPLIKDAYAMAMSYFKERETNKFIEFSFVNITHFSAVMYPQKPETLVEMDVSVAKFVNINSGHYFRTTDSIHLHRISNLIDYIWGVYRSSGKDTRLMTMSQDGLSMHISMIIYFTRFRDDILQHTIDSNEIIEKPTCFKEVTVFHFFSFMGTRGYAMGSG